jgi:Flp pilus assembly pilin Flp
VLGVLLQGSPNLWARMLASGAIAMWELILSKAHPWKRFVASEQGQAMVEYGLIMCLVVIVILVTLIVLGNQVRNTYCNIMGAVVGAGS